MGKTNQQIRAGTGKTHRKKKAPNKSDVFFMKVRKASREMLLEPWGSRGGCRAIGTGQFTVPLPQGHSRDGQEAVQGVRRWGSHQSWRGTTATHGHGGAEQGSAHVWVRVCVPCRAWGAV